MFSRHVTAQFDALLDGRLSAIKRQRVEAHLAQCADCRAAWEEHRAVWERLAALPAVAPSTGFTERVMRNLDRAPEQSRGAWIPAWRWALATTATVALAVALGVTLLREQPMLAAAPTEQQEEFKVAENLDLLQDFELIAALDQLETETTTDMSQENL